MVGITLTPEQIKAAPPEVRRWLEHQLALTLGLRLPEAEAPAEGAEQLVGLSVEETSAVVSMIETMLPTLSVFFELGRTGESIGRDGVELFRLSDMLRHTRLGSMDQLVLCLQTINEAARAVRHNESVALCILDQRGYCLVARETQQNIAQIWKHVMAAHAAQTGPGQEGPAQTEGQRRPFGLSAVIPPSSLHMGR